LISKTIVTTKDIKLADQEGFRSVEHLKRYTTLGGMATDQGQGRQRQRPSRSSPRRPAAPFPRVGTTTYRPPYVPVSFGAMSGPPSRGRDFRPVPPAAITPMGERSRAPCSSRAARGWRAAVLPAWLRSRDWLENRETAKSRGGHAPSVGVCDVSTLGKIEIEGHRRRGRFLDRVYCNTFLDAAGRQGAPTD